MMLTLCYCDSEMEQRVVSWKPDKEEKRCQSCGRGFNLRRRRHHCRLCGEIICKQCSLFMTLSETCESMHTHTHTHTQHTHAHTHTHTHAHPDPVLCDSPDYHSLAPPVKRSVLSLKRGRGRREGEGGATGQDEEEDQTSDLRMCSTCNKLINR